MLKFKSKNMFNGVSVHNIRKWLESIHNDTIEHGSEEEQYVLEQMLHYVKTEYKDKNGLENKNLMGY
tara:strand:- start:201 stop:401 length:201 start_codon:yes stop_codon:yes gene_type:complete